MRTKSEAVKMIEYIIAAGQGGGSIDRVSLPYRDLMDFYMEYEDARKGRDEAERQFNTLLRVTKGKKP